MAGPAIVSVGDTIAAAVVEATVMVVVVSVVVAIVVVGGDDNCRPRSHGSVLILARRRKIEEGWISPAYCR